MEPNNLINSFKDSIISDEAINLAKEYVGMTYELVINDEALKHIPIISTLLGFYKIGHSLKERQTFKKIVLFLSKLSDISQQEKEDFFNKLSNNNKYEENVFEKVLLLIERLDETNKAEIVGNLFKLYIKEAINKETFLRLSNIVDRSYIDDLLSLWNKYSEFLNKEKRPRSVSWSTETEQSLNALGLMEQILPTRSSGPVQRNSFNAESPKIEYTPSHLGRLLANLMYCDFDDIHFKEYFENLKSNLRGELAYYVPRIRPC